MGPPSVSFACSSAHIPFQRFPLQSRIYPHPIIAREGWPILGALLAVTVVLWALDFEFLTFIAFVAFLFALQFFRDPARELPEDPRAVVSPVDGRVCKVEPAVNPETGEDAVKISIFMNVFNVHSQKAPLAGVVEKVTYTPGLFLNADLDKASTENERNAVTVRTTKARRYFHSSGWPRCSPHHLLREGGRPPRARRALRLHSLRFARRRVSPDRR